MKALVKNVSFNRGSESFGSSILIKVEYATYSKATAEFRLVSRKKTVTLGDINERTANKYFAILASDELLEIDGPRAYYE